MPSSLTKLGVWNLALDLIKSTALQSSSDVAPEARWLERNWQHTIEVALRMYPWNCAKKYVKLSAETEAPPFGWSYAYKPPAGWLRFLGTRRNGTRFGAPVPHEIVGNLIYTNEAPPLYGVFIMDISGNPGLFDPLLVNLVKGELALGMANKFTGKERFIARCEKIVAQAQAKAEEIDAFEGSPEPVEQLDILRVRGADENYVRRLT